MSKIQSIHIGTILFIDEKGEQVSIKDIVKYQYNLEGIKIITNNADLELNLLLDKTGSYQIVLDNFDE